MPKDLVPAQRNIVQAYDLDVIVLLEESGMMLETELHTIVQREVTIFPIKPPDDTAVCAVDFVNATGIPSRDHVVTISILVDAVDVEVIPSVGAVTSRTSLAGVDGEYAFVW